MKIILILITAVSFIVVAFYMGHMFASFDVNMCYSEILADLDRKVDAASKSGDQTKVLKIHKFLQSLPLRGYESDCTEIRAIIKTYNKHNQEDARSPPL